MASPAAAKRHRYPSGRPVAAPAVRMRRCEDCGVAFTQHGAGRPRKRCPLCEPVTFARVPPTVAQGHFLLGCPCGCPDGTDYLTVPLEESETCPTAWCGQRRDTLPVGAADGRDRELISASPDGGPDGRARAYTPG